MSKRSIFTTITPIPAGISRDTVLETLHSHLDMIDLNPLVIHREPCKAPSFASAEDFFRTWYVLKDKISYLPGGLATGEVSYFGCFHDLPNGLQTHVFAPLGLEIKGKWTVGGSLSGEAQEPSELGLELPPSGLYLREDVDMKCNFLMTSFVKKTLKKSHASLVDRMVAKANAAGGQNTTVQTQPRITHGSSSSAPCGHASFRGYSNASNSHDNAYDQYAGNDQTNLGSQARSASSNAIHPAELACQAPALTNPPTRHQQSLENSRAASSMNPPGAASHLSAGLAEMEG